MAQMIFDASGVEPAAPMELLPPGKYVAQIVQSEMQPTKQGDGQMLRLEFDILDGPYRGRKLWDRLNLVNRNQQTVEIAQRQLSAICHAIGQIQVADSEQLHFKPVLVTLAVETDTRDEKLPVEQRRKQNRIKGYTGTKGAPAVPQQQTAQPARPIAATTTTTSTAAAARPAASTIADPPWRRSA